MTENLLSRLTYLLSWILPAKQVELESPGPDLNTCVLLRNSTTKRAKGRAARVFLAIAPHGFSMKQVARENSLLSLHGELLLWADLNSF